jgi:hypothetical protein
MGLIEDALARSNARPVKRIDYARMNRSAADRRLR